MKKIKVMTPATIHFNISLFKSELKRIGVRVYSVRKIKSSTSNGWKISYCYELGNSTLSVQKDVIFYADSLHQIYEQNFLY